MTGARWLTLVVVSAGTAMLLLDVTVVNVALPAIQDDLDASFAELQWVTVNAMKSAFLRFDERLRIINEVIKPAYARFSP